VPQLQHVHARHDFLDRRDALVVPLIAIRRSNQLKRSGRGDVHLEPLEHSRHALRIRDLGQREDVFEGDCRDALRDEEPAAVGDALDDGLGERRPRGVEVSGVDVAQCHASMVAEGRRPSGAHRGPDA